MAMAARQLSVVIPGLFGPAGIKLLPEAWQDLSLPAMEELLSRARRDSAEGRLAEIILLDQFSRNLYRNSPLAFACDPLALGLAQEAIRAGVEAELTPVQRSFLYLPFMHSESLAIHQVALQLYERNGLESNLEFERLHKSIIERFGRYPHRNAVLGRQSTAEELAFLQEPGSSF